MLPDKRVWVAGRGAGLCTLAIFSDPSSEHGSAVDTLAHWVVLATAPKAGVAECGSCCAWVEAGKPPGTTFSGARQEREVAPTMWLKPCAWPR